MRIGLLGGTFNPAHKGHLHISIEAMKRLGLDQVWWLVTIGNPLKSAKDRDNFEERLKSARNIASGHPRILVSDIEKKIGSAYTIDILHELKKEHPEHKFIWLMGADGLATFHKWKRWREIFKAVPIAVFDRPGYSFNVLNSRVAATFNKMVITENAEKSLISRKPPAWCFMKIRKLAISSTEIRNKKY